MFVNTTIVNAQSNLLNATNLSCLNSSFACSNISTSTFKYGNIINLTSTNTSFQNISACYLILDAATLNPGIYCQ